MISKIIKRNSSISQKDFDEAITGLLCKGLIEEKEVNGNKEYVVTYIGEMISNNLNLDPLLRN
jgi:predicted transcriptional regulator